MGSWVASKHSRSAAGGARCENGGCRVGRAGSMRHWSCRMGRPFGPAGASPRIFEWEGGRIGGSVANLPQNTLKIEKDTGFGPLHFRIWRGRSLLTFNCGGRVPSVPSAPPPRFRRPCGSAASRFTSPHRASPSPIIAITACTNSGHDTVASET